MAQEARRRNGDRKTQTGRTRRRMRRTTDGRRRLQKRPRRRHGRQEVKTRASASPTVMVLKPGARN